MTAPSYEDAEETKRRCIELGHALQRHVSSPFAEPEKRVQFVNCPVCLWVESTVLDPEPATPSSPSVN
jgi:hypothetical protein